MYFRVGSQQTCPACTEKFKKETRANLARYYRRALRDGIIVAIAGGVIHGILLAVAHVSFGSMFIGVLVGIAMRIASKESAGTPIPTDRRHTHVRCGIAAMVAGRVPFRHPVE